MIGLAGARGAADCAVASETPAARAMIDTGIEAQLFGDEAALLNAAGDPDRMASFDFGDLPDHRPDGTGGRRNDDSLPGLRLTDFEKTDIGGHPRHAEDAERRRDRRHRS
jgi:hypothetical protein